MLANQLCIIFITPSVFLYTYLFRLFQQQVCRAGYKVAEVFLYGDSRKNELYLSRFIPFFEAQVWKFCVLIHVWMVYEFSTGDLFSCEFFIPDAHSKITFIYLN